MSQNRNRPLTDGERQLAHWMLENGTAEAKQYLSQLELAEVTSWKCPCGCASIHFQIKGHPEAPPGVRILGDFLVGEGENQAGVFIYSSEGLLSGLEVYGLAGDAPRTLPRPVELRPW
ncbi:hypothetical protein SVA_2946 [Sulfurifustis variabilis]|uniref:Uncharacterized protein n=2 Tax=Sulfurifustis variabilis TaxID=1675686 RepID=A0A1B4VBB4_9GAMM|nr:hypothetical protein SVA_2946 [Sulfurifustis variabilis]